MTTLKVTKSELKAMIAEVLSPRRAPTPAKVTVAKVAPSVLKAQVERTVRENLSAVQTVVKITDSNVLGDAMKHIAAAAVAQAAIPDAQKNLAAAKIAGDLTKALTAPMRMALLNALKEMGTPEQVASQQAPGAGGQQSAQNATQPASPFGS